jgi:hypothetical protein
MLTKCAGNIGHISWLKGKDVEKADNRKWKDVYYVKQCRCRMA